MFEPVGESKVGDDDVSVAVEEEILELQITMNDFLLMDVPDTRDELGEKLGCIFFAQISMRENMIE